MADRVAIFNNGKIAQVGTPEDVYERPENRFVADFVGSSNVLAAGPFAGNRRPRKVDQPQAREDHHHAGRGRSPPAWHQSASAMITAIHYQGSVTRLNTRAAGGETINVTVPSSQGKFAEGDKIVLHWPKEALHVMAGEA